MTMFRLFKKYEEVQDGESVKANMGPRAPEQPEAPGGSLVWERKRPREGAQDALGRLRTGAVQTWGAAGRWALTAGHMGETGE